MVKDEYAEIGGRTDRSVDRRIGKNQMLWDLGLDELDNEDAVKKKVKDVEEKFSLVMILENFEESLILMKDLLCWDHSDITSLKLNARKSEGSQLKESTRQKLREVLKPDYALYNHFYKIFQDKLDLFGRGRMEEEVEKLREENRKIEEECNVATMDNRYLVGEARWWGPGLMGYKVDSKNKECKLMTMSELYYVDRIRNIQKERYNNDINNINSNK